MGQSSFAERCDGMGDDDAIGGDRRVGKEQPHQAEPDCGTDKLGGDEQRH